MAKKQLEKELTLIRQELAKLSSDKQEPSHGDSTSITFLLKSMIEEREKTNRMLGSLAEKIKKLETQLVDMEEPVQEMQELELPKIRSAANREIPLSAVDAKIIDFIQVRGMTCADEIKAMMNYRGRNAACARLNKLYKEGLLDRLQLGHKVYYKFDAGKATNTLIISPPQ